MAGQSTRLQDHLVLLVIATVVPAVLFATVLILYNVQLEHAVTERGMRDTARALAVSLDGDLQDFKSALAALSVSPYLDEPPALRLFYETASTVSRSFGGWAVLSTITGHQIINTSRPFGERLPVPSRSSLDLMQQVAAGGQPFVSNMIIGTVSRRPAVIVAMPVVRGGAVRYVLDFPFEPVRFTRLLEQTALSPGWIAVITDRDGAVVARVPEGANDVGRPLTGRLAQATAGSREGFLKGPLLSDAEVYAAYARSAESGWLVAVVAPRDVVEGSLRRSLLVVVSGGALLLAVALALAFLLARRIAAPIIALAESIKMAGGTPPHLRGPSGVQEVDELQRALHETSLLARTEQAARTEAEAANRAKDEFLAVLSHELRTPLNSMVGWVRLLRSGRLDPAQTVHALDVIDRNVGQQSRLIADLLDVSRIVIGRMTLDSRMVDLPLLVATAADAARPAAEAKGLTLTTTLAPDAGPVHGDPARLRQVVDNLLSNAVKFTPAGGRVDVRLSREGGDASLVVRDTGSGIAPELLPHVFERFRQGDSTSTRSHAGLGLGLTIVQHLVELHGGVVEAYSDGVGRGAAFTVRLPLAASGPPAGRRSTTAAWAAAPGRLDGVAVLVVEDDADARELLAAVLAEGGARVVAVDGAARALSVLAERRVDVIVCDLAMPGLDGFGLLRELRARPGLAGIPVLAVTAFARPEDRERAIVAGFRGYLAKPVEPAELVDEVRRLIAA